MGHMLLAYGCIVHLAEELHENIGQNESPLESVTYASKLRLLDKEHI